MPSSACDWSSDVCSSDRSEEHTSELQSRSDLVCRLLLEKKKKILSRAVQTRHITVVADCQASRAPQQPLEQLLYRAPYQYKHPFDIGNVAQVRHRLRQHR